MTGSRFVYVTYIRSTPKKLWAAFIQPEHTKVYWGCRQESEWTAGSAWKMFLGDGRLADAGKVLEIDPPRLLVLEWQNQFRPDLHEEGFSRCTIEIEAVGETTRLSVVHEIEREGSQFIAAVSGGWPMILSSLKTYLETGQPLPAQPQPSKDG
jgi:uncharacterized protein YndB with AHSA1/START domain